MGKFSRTCLFAIATFFLAPTAGHSAPTDTYLLFDEQVDGNADYVEIATSPELNLTGGSFTVSAWIRPSGWGDNNQGRIVDHGGGSAGSEGWSFHLENKPSSGSLQALRVQINNDGSLFGVSDGNAVKLDVWQHVAVTLEEQQLTFYVNGVASGAHANVPTPISSSEPIRIGARATDLARGFDGSIDDVRIWNRALSQSEVQASFAADLTGGEAGLISYHRMDEGSGQIVADLSSNGHSAVLGASVGVDVNDPAWAVSVAVNQAPSVDAGADQTIIFPTNTVTLAGGASDDDFPGNPLIIAWSVDGGPGTVTFSNISALESQASFSASGIYVLRLTGDDGEFSSTDTMTVTVEGAPVLTSIVVSPQTAAIATGDAVQFTAEGFDQAANSLPISPTWSATGGNVDNTGFYTAGSSSGNFRVDATDSEVTGSADVVVATPSDTWPTNGWDVATPESLNMDPVLLAQARDFALSSGGSGMITRAGKQVMAWGDQTLLYDLKSTTKSIGVTALGLALQDNLLSLNDFAQQFLPGVGLPPAENAATGWLDDITVLHLATHIAGFDKPGGYTSLLFAPGTAWSYTDGGANWLADVLTSLYGIDLNDLLSSRVFAQLGIQPTDLTWRNHLYREQTLNGVLRREFGSGISANVDAMARVGYLYLRNGQWDGQSLLPSVFIDQASRPVPEVTGLPTLLPDSFPNASDHYGFLWWNNGDGTLVDVPIDAYWSWGLNDSLIIVIPSLDVVAARAGGGWRPGWDADYSVIEPFIAPVALSASPLVPVTVPDVVGLSEAAATTAITNADLTLGTVTTQNDATVPAGNVISQNPAGGTSAPENSAVDLVVSLGPSVMVPTEDYLQFDGVDDVVTVADDASLDITAAITLEAWIRPATLSNSKAQDRVVHKTIDYELTVSTGDTGCHFGSNGDVQWRATIGGLNRRICGGALTPGVWQHIAGTYDGNEVVLYVGGLAVASASRSGPIATNNSALYLGNRASADRAFDGSIDEVRIWNRALTASEIAANRNTELTGAEPGLVAYYRLNEGSGQSAIDAATLGNDGVRGSTVNPEISDPQWMSQ